MFPTRSCTSQTAQLQRLAINVASLDMILSNKRITKGLMRHCCSHTPGISFSRSDAKIVCLVIDSITGYSYGGQGLRLNGKLDLNFHRRVGA